MVHNSEAGKEGFEILKGNFLVSISPSQNAKMDKTFLHAHSIVSWKVSPLSTYPL